MSVMCSVESCKARSGMCIHEKMMVGMLVLLVGGAAGHWMFHWF